MRRGCLRAGLRRRLRPRPVIAGRARRRHLPALLVPPKRERAGTAETLAIDQSWRRNRRAGRAGRRPARRATQSSANASAVSATATIVPSARRADAAHRIAAKTAGEVRVVRPRASPSAPSQSRRGKSSAAPTSARRSGRRRGGRQALPAIAGDGPRRASAGGCREQTQDDQPATQQLRRSSATACAGDRSRQAPTFRSASEQIRTREFARRRPAG